MTDNETWTVGEAEVEELPIVCTFLTNLPDDKTRAELTWLTVIAWEYDGYSNNGMPDKELNNSMVALEDALEKIVDDKESHLLVYTQTGSNLKEFVFYINDQDKFMQVLNLALQDQPSYPVKIDSYEDKDWSDLKKIQSDFNPATE